MINKFIAILVLLLVGCKSQSLRLEFPIYNDKSGFLKNRNYRLVGDKYIVSLAGGHQEKVSKRGKILAKPREYAVITERPKIRLWRLHYLDKISYSDHIKKYTSSKKVKESYFSASGAVGIHQALDNAQPIYYFPGDARLEHRYGLLKVDSTLGRYAVRSEQKVHFVREGSLVWLDRHLWRVKRIEWETQSIYIKATQGLYREEVYHKFSCTNIKCVELRRIW